MIGCEPMGEPITIRPATADDLGTMQEISVEARSRYRGLVNFEHVAAAPPVAVQRFEQGTAVVAVSATGRVLGFALSRPLDRFLFLDNISTRADCQGHGIGNNLLHAVLNRAISMGYSGVTLTTFREPPWNGPWFRKFAFIPMPHDKIGPELLAVIAYQAKYLVPSTREALWRPF